MLYDNFILLLKVLRPLEVTLSGGDALVWFPGWEHETVIIEGLSISISLHFDSPSDSVYQNTFHQELCDRVSHQCHWNSGTTLWYLLTCEGYSCVSCS